jgi:hypothetical protein
VKEAFKTVEVVRLDCSHVGTSDCKKIGVKLRVRSGQFSGSLCVLSNSVVQYVSFFIFLGLMLLLKYPIASICLWWMFDGIAV